MSLTIQLPEKVEQLLRIRAKAEGLTADRLAEKYLEERIIPPAANKSAIPDGWIDNEYHSLCELLADNEDRIEEVRKILAKIPGNMSDDIIQDREERF